MYVYAGIDEAGYGPVLGPMVIGRAVLVIPKLDADAPTPDLWLRLGKAVCKRISDRAGRIAVNDSKKLTTKAAGIKHLELGCLAFAGLQKQAGSESTESHTHPEDLSAWLDLIGDTGHHDEDLLPWYAKTDDHPWQTLPTAHTEGEVAIAGSLLRNCAERIGVELGGLGAAVVYENTFNQMVAATRSKASVSFTFVARHLLHIWETYSEHRPTVIIDRQGGRTHYRELLAQSFPDTRVDVIEECATSSSYLMSDKADPQRAMRISFMVDAEQAHMPVALASMVSKYTRELLMARLNHYFTQRVPDLKPTAGYAKDGKRFLEDLDPHLPELGHTRQQLQRTS